jgi:anhydro-N-acetylmuramic acid kinase
MTLQVGHPAWIAKTTHIATVADFRVDDMALEGQGAPLAPAFHSFLFKKQLTDKLAVINLGGIANISLVDGDQTQGWDTGPANALMDEICRRHFACEYDANGELAAQGHVNPNLLQQLLQDPYFALPAPKSTGRDYFNERWLERQLQDCANTLFPLDLLSTLNQLTVETLAIELEKTACPQIIVCGGGAFNQTLLARLRKRLPSSNIQTSLDWGIDPNAMEAMMCAWLAHQRLNQQPVDLRQVTGSKRPCVLGGLWIP